MGGQPSKDAPEMTPELEQVLEENKYTAGNAKFPYYVVQLSETEELPTPSGHFVSEALAALVGNSDFTHIIAQTHGWNTPPDKAVAVPFTEFIGGMQNDHAMPQDDDFRPLFVAFIWPALPIEFAQTDDALTRAEILGRQERELVGEDSDIAKAADAAKAAIEAENEDDDDLWDRLRTLVRDSKEDDDDDDEDAVINTAREKAGAMYDDNGEEVVKDRGILSSVKRIFRPVENLVFGRLMVRGQRTGVVMGSILGKLMKASGNKPKVCMMANSLGAHVLCGALNHPEQLPHRVHTVFFVQGAITGTLFEPGNKFENLCNAVAGPVVCSYSSRDLMLKNVYGPFHGRAIGFVGVPIGEHFRMKGLSELSDSPYELKNGLWNSINGSEFIDEGNIVTGGHGDFKEDETTSLYWSAIKTAVEPEAYDM